jgi:hypothetical protein
MNERPGRSWILGARDRMMEKLTAGTEPLERSDKIVAKVFFRNMFGGTDTGDAIKGFSGAKLEKIFDFDAALACQTRGANALAPHFRLMRAEGESKSLDAIIRRGVHHQRAPAASHIEQALTGPQAQLATNVIEFAFLRVGQRDFRRFEVGAAVTQRPVQP